jgi:hypothetical protein
MQTAVGIRRDLVEAVLEDLEKERDRERRGDY